MLTVKVRVNSISRLKKFISIVDRHSFDMWAKDESLRVPVNRTIAFFSLDLKNPITIETDDTSEEAKLVFDELSKSLG